MEKGDRVEAKLRPGLGNWQRVTVVEHIKRDTVTVEHRGIQYDVPRRRVRPIPNRKKPAKERRCSYCKQVGHDIRSCENLSGFAKSLKAGKTGSRERTVVSYGGEMRPVPKSRAPLRSEVYMDFIRAKPCMWCGAAAPSDPDHVGPHGLGQKTDDLRTVPACRTCHSERHDKGRVKPHTKEETVNMIYKKQVDYLVEFAGTIGGDRG